MAKKERNPNTEKSMRQVHLLKDHRGEWAGSTFCGISFRHKKFFENQIATKEENSSCDKCKKAQSKSALEKAEGKTK